MRILLCCLFLQGYTMAFSQTSPNPGSKANHISYNNAGNIIVTGNGALSKATGTLACNNWLATPSQPSYAQIGDLDVAGNQITIEAVINRTTAYTGGYLYAGDIVSKHRNRDNTNYLLRPNSAEITTSNGYFVTPQICDITLNKTYHVAFVYNGSSLKFYRNGFLMSEVPATGNLFQNDFITRIGEIAFPDPGPPTNFAGFINQVRIWNVARTQAQIQSYMNNDLPNPTTTPGLLAYYTFDNLLNKQGNTAWNGTLTGAATINATNTSCNFVADNCNGFVTDVTASFDAPATVCVNTPVQVVNTSQNASNYYWSFCESNFQSVPVANNLGNPGSALSFPVFTDIAKDAAGNYFSFTVNNSPSGIVRYSYGNSLLNTPAVTSLGNPNGALPGNAEGIQVIFANNKWTAIVVGGDPPSGNPSAMAKFDFGNALTNTPTGTNLGNIGNMNYPTDLIVFQENNNWYGYTVNFRSSTISKFSFGTDFTTITGTNLGNIGNLNNPVGIGEVKSGNNWYLFITNETSNSLTRLSFGSSLGNSPTGVNIGNPGNLFGKPRDISFIKLCDGITALAVNGTTNEISKLDFQNDVTNTPTAVNLGNIGNMSFPHSISELFREGGDIYAFVPNVNNNTITRINFQGCQTIPGSSQQTPGPITYTQPGTYNINLIVDIGLPSQASFCKKIVVDECLPNVTVSFDAPATVCVNTPVQVVNTSQNASNYYWSFCETNFQATPAAVNLGNPGTVLRKPVFSELVKDQNGNYFAFINNHEPASLVRYQYGDSYLNTPVVDDLGDFGGALVRHPEGIKIVRSGSNWIGVIVGGDPTAGDVSKVSLLNFGANLTNNTPVVNSYPNIGGINFPHDLAVFNAGNHWYGYTTNVGNSTMTKFDFGTDFSAAPTGTNIGSPGGLNSPVGIGEINNNGDWHLFIMNGNSTLTRFDFGSSLNNTFTAVNIGNPGNALNIPRDISFIKLCDGITALVVNAGDNSISKLDFHDDLLAAPTITQYGNIGNLDFPHSLSSLFRVDNDLYTLISNVNNNSVTRLRFEGCQTVPGSSQQTPGPITYTQPGTYNINLIVDIGLPTQTSFCKKIVVEPCLTDTIINNYTPVLSLDICKNILNVEDASKYNVGDTVLLIQMKGAAIDSTNTAAFGTITDYKNAGNYEFNYIKSKTGNAIELLNVITSRYDLPSGRVQLIRVPYFKSITTNKIFTCLPWDGSKGGVLVLNAKDTITLNAPIDVSGRGFRGGKSINSGEVNWTPTCGTATFFTASTPLARQGKGEGIAEVSEARSSGRGPLANGGGGGNFSNSGGGGGSNSTAGGKGGDQFQGCTITPNNNGGIPGNGIPYSTAANKVFMGGGGGAGDANDPLGAAAYTPDGGNGGGIVIINSDYFNAEQYPIRLNGDNGKACTNNCAEGGGGGGAGGTLLLHVNNLIASNPLSSVIILGVGGSGADNVAGINNFNHGPGGGGSGGVILLKGITYPPIPVLLGALSGGFNGMSQNSPPVAWGATPGSFGIHLFGLVLPVDNVPFKQNIDSVRFTPVQNGCRAFNFNGIPYINTAAISTWQWTFGDGGTAGTQNTSHTYAAAGSFPVKVIITDINGCKDSVTNNVLITSVAVDAGLDTAYCSSLPVTRTLHATSSGPWSWTPAAFLDNSTAQHPIATVTATTKFYVTVPDAFGCSVTDSITITVKPLPNVRTLADSAICKGSPLVMHVTGGTNYTWSPAAYVSNASSPDPTFTNANSQTVYVSGTGANGCIGKDTINITVKPLPTVHTIGDSLICSNQNILLTATGGQTYTWSPAAGLDNANSPSPVFSGTHGTGTYYVTGTAANNCMAKDTVRITVRGRTAIVAPPDKEMCFKTSVVLNGNNGNNVTYAWSPAATLSNPAIINPVATPANTQVYTLTMNDKVCKYDSSFSVTVTVNPLPAVDAGKTNDISCAQPTARLSATGAVSYIWTPASTLTGANTATPVAKPMVTTLYKVSGTDVKGCVNTDTITVFYDPQIGGLGMPNAFTPNGDRTNECFGVRHWGTVTNLVFIIYDRWGEKVFETNDASICWDGRYKGNPAEAGSYVYFIKGKIACGEITRKGSVLLIR